MRKSTTSILPFSIGEFSCHAINDGRSTYATAEFLFADAPQPLLIEELERYGETPESIPCSNTCLVIETGQHRILIDAGGGQLSQMGGGAKDLGQLPDHLASLDMAPESFDFVLFTHMHNDHAIGGLKPDVDEPLFPNARHVVSQTEWTFLAQDRKEPLLPLEPLLEFFEGQIEVVPGIKMIPAFGHSSGHCAIRIQSEGQELVCLGDIVAHPLNLDHPDWTMHHEPDKALAVETRMRHLKQASETGCLVHAYHMPFPSIGHIYRRDDDGGFRWEPL